MKIIWLNESVEPDPAAGVEAACLSRLHGRYPVPAGFCLLPGPAVDGELPAAAATGLVVAYNQLAKRCGQPDPLVTVSSLAEPPPSGEAAFGPVSLPVSGREAVLAEVRRRLAAPADSSGHGAEAAGLLIRQSLPADLTGLALSQVAANGRPADVLISAAWGLGPGTGAEPAGADSYRVAKVGLALLESRIGERRQMTVIADGAAALVAVPRFLRTEPVLTAAQAQAVARMVIALERELQGPVAVAFAYAGEELSLLRCRPLAGHSAAAALLEPMAGASGPPVVQPIPAIPEFPVVWERPEDEGACWLHDSVHSGQVMPMFASFFGPRAVALSREEPGSGSEYRRINTYLYRRPPQVTGGPPPEEAPVLTAGQLQALWEHEILPEIQTQCLQLASIELTTVPPHALGPQVEELIDRYLLIWGLHQRITGPLAAAQQQYRELHEELFPRAATAETAEQLLQGFDNRWQEARRELWRLGREAANNHHLRPLFAGHSSQELAVLLASNARPAASSLAALALEGWLRQFRLFLDRFGRRFALGDWSRPSWREDPTAALGAIQGCLAEGATAPADEAAQLAARRERAEEEAHLRLAGYPRPVRERFQSHLRAAQTAEVLQADLGFWIEHWCMDEVRRAVRSLGRRFFADGMLDSPEEIWFLSLEEARAVAAGAREMSLRSRVAHRRQELERWAGVTPPERLGSCPPSR